MPNDFVQLGFTPPEQLERVRQSNLTEGLSFVLRQLSQGGGGKKITERVRAEWREKYDPDGTLSPDELRQKVREEYISSRDGRHVTSHISHPTFPYRCGKSSSSRGGRSSRRRASRTST